jgi:hypothetical protein
MVFVAPDILADACGLSLGLMLLAVPVGLLLWILGWWSHRFWVVMVTTVLAGVYGLQAGSSLPAPPIFGAVLLALAAGVLALNVVRLVAFAAGGVTGLLLMQVVYPSLNQPLIAFLVSGLVCLALFRPFMMALTSLAGAVLLVSVSLMLLNYYAVVDAPAWCEQSAQLVNWLTGSLAAVGWGGQFLLDRYVFRKETAKKGWLGELWKLVPARSVPSAPKPAPVRRAA